VVAIITFATFLLVVVPFFAAAPVPQADTIVGHSLGAAIALLDSVYLPLDLRTSGSRENVLIAPSEVTVDA
jgi:hypothetical protein